MSTASTRLPAPSVRKIRLMWFFTVFSLTCSSAAISALRAPRDTSAITSC